MILHELRALALREGLVDDPAFESKPVAWIIELNADGRYLGLKSTCVEVAPPEGKKGKPKLQATMHSIPRRNGRRAKDAADFLVDKAEYVLGTDPNSNREQAALETRRTLFIDDLKRASGDTTSKDGRIAISFLENDQERGRCITELGQLKCSSNDLFCFSVEYRLLHQDETLRKWWADSFTDDTDFDPVSSRQCLICGRIALPVGKHDATFIPGSTSPSSPLVSFNKSSFEKYGLARNENAPVCRACMTAYFEGLKRLISPRYVSARTGEVVIPQNTRLSGDTTAVYWSSVDDPLLGILSELLYSPQQVRDLLLSPRRGQRTHLEHGRFYCLILSGAQGRAMLRTTHAGTLGELEKNLERFFKAVRLDGRDDARPQGLGGLLRSLVLDGKLDRLPPHLAEQLFVGVLFGAPMPRLVLAAATARNRAEQHVSPERAALLQLYFNSRNHMEVPLVSLNETSTLPGYRLGRLLAAYERVQVEAQGRNLNRTLVDRYFGAASTRPGTVFPQLVKLSKNHFGKLAERGIYLEKLVSEIIDGLAVLPPMLSLEEQGHFALGYYHQRQRFFRKAADPLTVPPTGPLTDQPTAQPADRTVEQPELAIQGDPA